MKNLEKLLKGKKKTITLMIGLIIGLYLLESSGLIGIVRSPIQSALVPLQLSLYKTRSDFQNFLNTVVDIRTLREGESSLRAENAQLLAENGRLKKLEAENNVLREQLGAKKIDRELIVAAVIGQDPLIASSEILVDKGSVDDVKRGELVVVEDILIGEVVSVGEVSSRVRLLSDAKTKIPAVSEDGVKGILKGEFGNSISFDKVVQGEKLARGQIIFSSGEAGIPKGLVLGKIDKIENDPAALFQKANVQPLLPLDNLETVFIIKKR